MPLTKATTNVVNLDKDTLINGINAGRGAGNINSNTVFGSSSLNSNTTGINNTALGLNTLLLNTSGANNVAVGTYALDSNTTGGDNVAVGVKALDANVDGYQNVAVGLNTLLLNTSGANNVAVGTYALDSNTTGNSNTAIGVKALDANVDGINNTAVGLNTLLLNTSGAYNVAVGTYALDSNTTGDNNTAIGRDALGSNTTFSNVGGFGYNAQVSGSNQIRIGNTSITSVTCQTNAWSDERDKSDIRDTVLGLDFIQKLRPVDFKWDYREDYRPKAPESVAKPAELKEDASDEEKAKYAEELSAHEAYVVLKNKWLEDCKWSNLQHDGTHKRTRFHHGLIAQEVKALIEQTGVDFGGFQDHTIKGGDAVMTIGYTELIGPLIKAVQELSAKVAELEAK